MTFLSLKKYGIVVNINLSESNEITNFCIYKIQNKINNKVYIGQTNNITARLLNHLSSWKKGINLPLYKSFTKHTLKNFTFEIIYFGYSYEDFNKKEKYYIDFYQSANSKNGYNIQLGGINSDRTIEWNNKRIAKAGSENAKKYGKPKTEEEKRYLSENSPKFWKGKARDQETKDKISASKRGQLPSNTRLVYKVYKDTNIVIDTYPSTTEAARKNPGFTQSKISRICNNKAKSKEGFTFTFKNESQ